MDEILLIDKPAGMTSFGVVARVRRVLSNRAGKKIKVGHAGTLDPFATGLMIILTGQKCREAGEYSKLDKWYDAEVKLGQVSSTGDPEGELTSVSDKQPTRQQIDEALLHCEERKVEAQASGRTKAALDFPAALRVMGAYNAAILQLLEGFFFLEDTKSMLVRDVAREIGELTGETAGQAQAVMQALIQREDQGSTAITGCHMILLHCRSAAVTQLQFGIIHVGSWFLYPAEPAEKIRTVIVMLAPLQSSCYELETIGHISAILLERWGLIEVLHEGDKMLIQKELMHIFKTFYAKKYKELLEG